MHIISTPHSSPVYPLSPKPSLQISCVTQSPIMWPLKIVSLFPSDWLHSALYPLVPSVLLQIGWFTFLSQSYILAYYVYISHLLGLFNCDWCLGCVHITAIILNAAMNVYVCICTSELMFLCLGDRCQEVKLVCMVGWFSFIFCIGLHIAFHKGWNVTFPPMFY